MKSLVFCNRSTTHFTVLKYQSDIQSAARQATSNNLQLCYQKYLLSYAPSSQSALKTRKQNYIIIFTSLLGSFLTTVASRFQFFNKMLKTMLKVCWNCWKLKNYCRKYYIVNHIYIIRKYNLTYIIPIQYPQKSTPKTVQIDYTIPHIPYHNI